MGGELSPAASSDGASSGQALGEMLRQGIREGLREPQHVLRIEVGDDEPEEVSCRQ